MRKFFNLLVIVFFTVNLSAQTKEEPSGKLSGNFFIDYYYNMQRDSSLNSLPNKVLSGDEELHGLKIRRVYLTYDYKYSSKISSRFRLESDETNFTTNLSGDKANKFGMFIKDAFVKLNYFKSNTLWIGIQATPAFEISESFWGNRYIEKTIMDLRGAVPSRDLAISLRGNIDSKGLFKYWVMYGNSNAGLPESDIYKRLFGHVEISPVKDLSVTLYSDYQFKKSISDAFKANHQLSNNILTSAFFIGYKKKNKMSVGVDTYYRIVDNGYKLSNKYENQEGYGLSAFAMYYIKPQINVFARFDRFEPNLDNNSKGDTRNLYIGGLCYNYNEKLAISPNIFIETFEKTGNIDIENSITPRLTLTWAF
ncbi:MAG: hypothetical protein A2X02_08730 [Bacteroidetes bacterium GWF2_29_10]|nr:MAG: hypothetical protein A2X02_08730 [Bacteroidetes bacterium GWF2_29_10]